MTVVNEVTIEDDFNTGRLKWNQSLTDLELALNNATLGSTWGGYLDTVSGLYVDTESLLISGYLMHADFHTAGVVNDLGEWGLYVNSLRIPPTDITSMTNDTTRILITLNTLSMGYDLGVEDSFMLWGPVIEV